MLPEVAGRRQDFQVRVAVFTVRTDPNPINNFRPSYMISGTRDNPPQRQL